MDFYKLFFLLQVFDPKELIKDSFEPMGPPVDPLLDSNMAPRGAKNDFYHNLGTDEWIFTNFFFLCRFLTPRN